MYLRTAIVLLALLSAPAAQAQMEFMGKRQHYEEFNAENGVQPGGGAAGWYVDDWKLNNGPGTGSFFLVHQRREFYSTILNDITHKMGPKFFTERTDYLDVAGSNRINAGSMRSEDAAILKLPPLADQTTGLPCELDDFGCYPDVPAPGIGAVALVEYQYMLIEGAHADGIGGEFFAGDLFVFLWGPSDEHVCTMAFNATENNFDVPVAYKFYRELLGKTGPLHISRATCDIATNMIFQNFMASDPSAPWIPVEMESGCTFGDANCDPALVPFGVGFDGAVTYRYIARPYDTTAPDVPAAWVHASNDGSTVNQTTPVIMSERARLFARLRGLLGNHIPVRMLLSHGSYNTPLRDGGSSTALCAQPDADLNKDGAVGGPDFGIFAAQFGEIGFPRPLQCN